MKSFVFQINLYDSPLAYCTKNNIWKRISWLFMMIYYNISLSNICCSGLEKIALKDVYRCCLCMAWNPLLALPCQWLYLCRCEPVGLTLFVSMLIVVVMASQGCNFLWWQEGHDPQHSEIAFLSPPVSSSHCDRKRAVAPCGHHIAGCVKAKLLKG